MEFNYQHEEELEVLSVSTDGTRRATARVKVPSSNPEDVTPKGQINKWPHKTLRCPAQPGHQSKKADVFVGTSFVCLALVSRMGRIPEWPPQDSNPSPRLKDDKVALLVPSGLLAQMVPGGQPYRP
ncbi:hypothetical protein VitviT2T_030348 [Vitis vinifera]|uniref:Uncharacterized protein n=1 Tax=Vitis vinifera TaxID=29760 RepID=A0ABY9E0J9_VITVI|nr:hypothetical protein VitviT2T_030348 [Vitis vinifera]